MDTALNPPLGTANAIGVGFGEWLGANMKTKITMKQARLNALKVLDAAEARREARTQNEARCSFCHGGPHTLGECPACGIGDEAEKEIKRLNGIIRRASVRFFQDGADGETAAAMLKILDEAKAPNDPSSGTTPRE